MTNGFLTKQVEQNSEQRDDYDLRGKMGMRIYGMDSIQDG